MQFQSSCQQHCDQESPPVMLMLIHSGYVRSFRARSEKSLITSWASSQKTRVSISLMGILT